MSTMQFDIEAVRRFVDTICKGPPRSSRREQYESKLFRHGHATVDEIAAFRFGMVRVVQAGVVTALELELIDQWIDLNVSRATTPPTSLSNLEDSVARRPLRC